MILRTFSKVYGLAGLRVGYALGSEDFRAAVDRVRQPFSVNKLAQAAATEALQASGQRRRARRAGTRSSACGWRRSCGELGLEVADSQANFCWVVAGRQRRARRWSRRSRAPGVAVRPGGALGRRRQPARDLRHPRGERALRRGACGARSPETPRPPGGSRPRAGGGDRRVRGPRTCSTTTRRSSTSCNGSEHLCDRALDEVAFAATHNSMSAADQPGWRFTQQEKGIPRTARGRHPGAPDRHVLRVPDLARSSERAGEQDHGPRQAGSELGATSTSVTRSAHSGRLARPTRSRDVRDFLAAHPREVLLISVEDHVRPRDVGAGVRAERAATATSGAVASARGASRPCAR